MSSFYKTLMAVLNDEPNIPELPKDKLIASNKEGSPISNYSIPGEAWLKLVRLQTLIFLEAEKGSLPEFSEINESSIRLQQSPHEIMSDSLKLGKETFRRIAMIERLIAEVVHDAIPTECDRLGVTYFCHISEVILAKEIETERAFSEC